MNKISVFSNEELLTKAAADYILECCKKSIELHGRFTIALSGGQTPAALFSLLATPAYATQLPWKLVFVFWGDERCVPPDDERSNAFQAKKLLLDLIDIPAENVFTVPIKMPPAKAAHHYEQTLKIFFRTQEPVFDLILLGMGDNGHTASLFPKTPILQEKNALVKEVYVKEQDLYRVSFTAPLINHASHILFLVTGKSKAGMLHKVLEGRQQPDKYPAQLVRSSRQTKVTWFIDQPAASQLKDLP